MALQIVFLTSLYSSREYGEVNKADCRNFTQLIWKSTLRLGASRIWLQSKNLVAVVAFYTPRGNKNGPGEFAKNILPPKVHHHQPHLCAQDSSGDQGPANCARSATVVTSDYGSSSDQGLNQITSNMNRNLNLNING
uniref:SCP domain-containing protein n=1 Tax=Romanomermis culicivorax TaxID=13658 RepID=A0A915IYN1_ROMCU